MITIYTQNKSFIVQNIKVYSIDYVGTIKKKKMSTISSALESVDMTSENLRAVIRKAIGKCILLYTVQECKKCAYR